MEPIKISTLQGHIHDFVLRNQKEYNPDFNDELNEAEIKKLQEAFGVKDIKELQNAGLDTFSSEKCKHQKAETPEETDVKEPEATLTAETEETKTDTEEQVAEEPVVNDSEKTNAEEAQTPDESDDGNRIKFESYDTAANNLNGFVKRDMTLSDAGTSMGTIYDQYVAEIKKDIKEGRDTSSAENMIGFIRGMTVETFDVQTKYKKDAYVEKKTCMYGKNNDKKVILEQSVKFGGNNSFANKNGLKEVTTTESAEGDTEQPKNQLDGSIDYSISAQTENGRYLFATSQGTDNQHYYLAGMYNKTFDNGGNLAITGTGKLTVDKEDIAGSGGIAADYITNDFSAGAYFYGKFENSVGTSERSYKAEGYAKYKDIVRLSGGFEKEYGVVSPSGRIKLYGEKELSNSGLSFTGSFSTDVSGSIYDKTIYGADATSEINIDVKARGGISFKADDISANLDGMFVYGCNIDPYATKKEEKYLHTFGGILLGNFRKGKLEASATVCAYKGPSQYVQEGQSPITVASTFALKLHEIIKNITPVVSCTIGNNTTGSRAAIQAGVVTEF